MVRDSIAKGCSRWLSTNLRSVRASIFTPRSRGFWSLHHRAPTKSPGDCREEMENLSTRSKALMKITDASREKASYPASR
jgi:hypothetical protein